MEREVDIADSIASFLQTVTLSVSMDLTEKLPVRDYPYNEILF